MPRGTRPFILRSSAQWPTWKEKMERSLREKGLIEVVQVATRPEHYSAADRYRHIRQVRSALACIQDWIPDRNIIDKAESVQEAFAILEKSCQSPLESLAKQLQTLMSLQCSDYQNIADFSYAFEAQWNVVAPLILALDDIAISLFLKALPDEMESWKRYEAMEHVHDPKPWLDVLDKAIAHSVCKPLKRKGTHCDHCGNTHTGVCWSGYPDQAPAKFREVRKSKEERLKRSK